MGTIDIALIVAERSAAERTSRPTQRNPRTVGHRRAGCRRRRFSTDSHSCGRAAAPSPHCRRVATATAGQAPLHSRSHDDRPAPSSAAPAEAPATHRIFSGIQPSGIVHLGNDLGAIRNYVALQEQYEAIYCIVDYHALTSLHDPDALRSRTRDMAASLLALGLDPEKCTLFVQSHRPEHTELAWIFDTVTPVSWVERTPTVQGEEGQQPRRRERTACSPTRSCRPPTSSSTRPIAVPVGEDQAAHLELTREIVRAFNNRYGDDLPGAARTCSPRRRPSSAPTASER